MKKIISLTLGILLCMTSLSFAQEKTRKPWSIYTRVGYTVQSETGDIWVSYLTRGDYKNTFLRVNYDAFYTSDHDRTTNYNLDMILGQYISRNIRQLGGIGVAGVYRWTKGTRFKHKEYFGVMIDKRW